MDVLDVRHPAEGLRAPHRRRDRRGRRPIDRRVPAGRCRTRRGLRDRRRTTRAVRRARRPRSVRRRPRADRESISVMDADGTDRRHRDDPDEPTRSVGGGDGPPGGEPAPWPTPGSDPTEIGLVVFANATAGRLLDQQCIRGQAFLRSAGLRNAGIVNVDNSCAGGASALHLSTLAALGGTGHVLAVGVEKMWTGDRAATLAGIEDGVPMVDRTALHRDLENPSGSVLMALNARWAASYLDGERGRPSSRLRPPRSRPAGTAPSTRTPSSSPRSPSRRCSTSATIVTPLTRLMCSSFTDGAAAAVLTAQAAGRRAPHPLDARCGPATGRSTTTSDWPRRRRPRGTRPASTRVRSTSSSCTTRPAPRSSTPSSRSASSSPGDAGPATLAGDTTLGGDGVTVNPSGGLVSRGHPLGATGIAQVVELAAQLRGAGGRPAGGRRPIGRGGQHRWHDRYRWRHHRRGVHRHPRARGGLSRR